MSVILYLDTATDCLQLGISQDGEMRVGRRLACESHRYHSAMLIPTIQEMLAEAALTVQDLKALAVHVGPGSFTGLRTGIITARMMGQFLEIPVHCLNAFDILAFERQEPTAVYLDALRGRGYHAVLRYESAGPVYDVLPRLEVLADSLPKPSSDDASLLKAQSARLLISEALIGGGFFQGQEPDKIPAVLETPAIMMAFIEKYGGINLREWQDVRPLYLQEPSVTLKKMTAP